MNEKKAIEIMKKCLDEMYKASDPPISWEEIEKKYEGVDNWFWKHEIEERKYEEIRDKYKKQLPPKYRRTLEWELLNYAPKFKMEK